MTNNRKLVSNQGMEQFKFLKENTNLLKKMVRIKNHTEFIKFYQKRNNNQHWDKSKTGLKKNLSFNLI